MPTNPAAVRPVKKRPTWAQASTQVTINAAAGRIQAGTDPNLEGS
jgi:hypothetical protein